VPREHRAPQWPEVELLLVDNGSTDGSLTYLRGYAAARPHVRLFENRENLGFAGAVNRALASATGRYLVLLNNDSLVTADWLAGLVAALEASPRAGLVGPVSNHAAPPQRVAADYGSVEELAAFARELAALRLAPRRVHRLVGFCLLARREVLEAIGAFDERYGSGNYEDDDWCLRAEAAGFDLMLAPSVFVHHRGGATFAGQQIGQAASLTRNARLFEQKWGCSPGAWRERGLTALDPFVLARNLTLPLPQSEPLAPADSLRPGALVGEPRLELFLAAALGLVRAGRSEALTDAFSIPEGWEEPERGHQAVRRLCQLVLDCGPRLPDRGWIELYAAAARGLADVLERRPAEPVLLNVAGVLLYELSRYEEAVTLFARAAALDPTLPGIDGNLAGAERACTQGPRLQRPADGETARRLTAVAERAGAATRATVSLCMIVRDEQALLPYCLASARAAVDEIVVVDTGSSDRSVEIASGFGAHVLRHEWSGSFASARNAGLDVATSDWILYLDADERLVDGAAAQLRPLLGRSWREGYFLELRNLTGRPGDGSAVLHPALRLFRNRPAYRFEGRIHEQVSRLMPTYLPERFEQAGPGVLHLGYLDMRVRERDKPRRNLALLAVEAEEAPSAYVSFNLGSEYERLGDWETAAVHFERAWGSVAAVENWPTIGFAPLLALRTARARRECGRLADACALLEHASALLPLYTDLVFERALCALAADDRACARRLLERCLELGDAPARFPSTVGAGSRLAREFLAQLEARDAACA
jgi:GT2 family glycosyltransferase